jgi:hypothetical protein
MMIRDFTGATPAVRPGGTSVSPPAASIWPLMRCRGRVGAVALSPFIRPGTTSTVAYNHYSLLKTVEEIFGFRLLGDAKQPQVSAFGRDVFTH